MAADVIRGPRMLQHAAAHVRLPQAEDADQDNDTGLPRTLVFNVAIPVGAPSLMGGGDDSKCYQLVLFFRASVAALREWRDGGSPAYALFRRWVEEAPHGNVEVKERFKLIVRMENLRELGRLGSTLEQYNGAPLSRRRRWQPAAGRARPLPPPHACWSHGHAAAPAAPACGTRHAIQRPSRPHSRAPNCSNRRQARAHHQVGQHRLLPRRHDGSGWLPGDGHQHRPLRLHHQDRNGQVHPEPAQAPPAHRRRHRGEGQLGTAGADVGRVPDPRAGLARDGHRDQQVSVCRGSRDPSVAGTARTGRTTPRTGAERLGGGGSNLGRASS
eukprot:scaffold7426_cov140-Isochrysis_galbana.AAC.2